MFTEEQLAEILEICHKATEGPWETAGRNSEYIINKNNFNVCLTRRSQDARFIALARTALPQLAEEVIKLRAVAEVIELEKENAKLRAVAEVAKHFYGICFDMPIDFPSAGPFVWGMGDLKEALTAAGYGGED